MGKDDEYGCSSVGVVAGACSLTEDGPLEVVRLQTGVGSLIDDFLAASAFGDIDGFFTLLLVFEDDAVVL